MSEIPDFFDRPRLSETGGWTDRGFDGYDIEGIVPESPHNGHTDAPDLGPPVRATSLVEGRPPVDVIEMKSTPLQDTGRDTSKHHIEGQVAGRPVSLIARKYEQRYVEAWKAYREAGLPVVPTLRVDPVRDRLIMTDLKADGGELYGKNLSLTLNDELPRDRPPNPAVDEHFLRLMSGEDRGKVVDRVLDIGEQATAQRIVLPIDDPLELKVSPDGRWEVLSVDLALGYRWKAPTPEDEEFIGSANYTRVRNFLGRLGYIAERLAQRQREH
ncbi:MAG TPA: hypothetical protein VFT16_03575 [Candidatus Saccharimonadales bacterium]|nr:hypothetical protein [Candidatus Saccharimonadales bacterium]